MREHATVKMHHTKVYFILYMLMKYVNVVWRTHHHCSHSGCAFEHKVSFYCISITNMHFTVTRKPIVPSWLCQTCCFPNRGKASPPFNIFTEILHSMKAASQMASWTSYEALPVRSLSVWRSVWRRFGQQLKKVTLKITYVQMWQRPRV